MTTDPQAKSAGLSILSDQPTDKDQLDFDPYARTLAEMIVDPGTKTPLTIGVFGDWGQGKTSLLQMVRQMVEDAPPTPAAGKYNIHIEHATSLAIGDGAQVIQSGGTATPPAPAKGAVAMNYEQGFAALQAGFAANQKRLTELATLAERFRENERAERLFGGSQNTRNERSQIVYALNELALTYLGVSFNDLCAGAKVPPPEDRPPVPQAGGVAPSSSPPAQQAGAPAIPPPEPPAPRTPFQIQLTRQSATRFEVRGLKTSMGEPHDRSRSPYTEEELRVVLKALRLQRYSPDRFNSAQRDLLEKLDLLIPGERLAPDILKRIGKKLYKALLPDEMDTAFQMALNAARDNRAVVALQMRFDEDAVDLAAYPWELLYYRRALLASRAVELTRYISYPEAVTTLAVTPPLRLLYVRSRPSDQEILSDAEETAVRDALSGLEEEGQLQVETIAATREAFLDAIETCTAHVLHFDGHGVFARRCPACGALNYAHLETCRAKQGDQVCGQPLDLITPQGYLAFEGAEGKTDLVSSEELGNYLYNSPIRLAVLSACWSGTVSGATLFGGVAPALVQAGLPAVVAAQLPIEVGAAATFAQYFYRALARFETLPAAVNAGRMRILNTNEWYIPTLYLRSKDNEGQLFASEGG